jgi:glycosyltransferase involved in cell wall biosynthesis
LYVTTTLGEGWGLTLTEAMATKKPIICPLSTSFIEMTDKGSRVYGCENLIPICGINDNIIREQCDLYEVADNIIHVAKGMSGQLEDIGFTDNFNKRIESGYNYTLSLNWKDVCKVWIKYFKETY